MDNLYNNLYQMNKNKNNQDLLSLLSQRNQAKINFNFNQYDNVSIY